ncbi:MAG: chorismate-binding protein [Bacteroidota bacterium]
MNQTRLQFSFREAFHTALDQRLPVALWRMPSQAEKHLIVDLSGKPTHLKPNFAELDKGFLVAPFENQEKSYFLYADLHFRESSDEINESFRAQTYGTNIYEARDAFFEQLKSGKTSTKSFLFEHPSRDTSVAWENYREALLEGVEEIRRGTFQKFVLSRTKQIPLKDDFSALETFFTLCEKYPTAFVSLVSAPKIGTWICATPETLIAQDKEGVFRTMALAGTQARNGLEDLRQASWRQKEIEEQALVSRYIIDCFKKIRLRNFHEHGPRTVAAGNLIHLRTDFWVDTKANNFPELPTVMLELLHPTSAVCGMPKEPALQFIKEHEGYDRSFYSGFLGPIHVEEESHLFVQLRCMQFRRDAAILYAGGGITIDSEPEKEWQETEMKFQTLGAVLS